MTIGSTITQPQLATCSDQMLVEMELMENATELVKQKWIFGDPLTLEDLVHLNEEHEIGDSPHIFVGVDSDIVALVKHEIAVQAGTLIEVDSNLDDGEQETEPDLTCTEMLQLFQKLEYTCLRAEVDGALDLSKHLHIFCGQMRQLEVRGSKQITLDTLWKTMEVLLG